MPKTSLLLRYRQLPSNYSIALSSASQEKLEILTAKFEVALKKSTPQTIFVEGTAEPIFKIIKDNTTGLNDFWGVDFIEYFKGVFNNESNYVITSSRFVFIYNIGLERAVNTTFSAKLLKGIIKDLEAKGCWVILESDISYQKFKTSYDIDIINKIVIPLRKPESFL